MSAKTPEDPRLLESAKPSNDDDSPQSTPTTVDSESEVDRVKEVGGRNGLDPVRYGDWEKGGRCIDF